MGLCNNLTAYGFNVVSLSGAQTFLKVVMLSDDELIKCHGNYLFKASAKNPTLVSTLSPFE